MARRVACVVCATLVACNTGYGSTTPPSPDASTDAGTCIANVDTDPLNCGRCGHDCLGGSCAGGKCAYVVVASGQATPESLAIGANAIFWTNVSDGSVVSAPTSGGPPLGLASMQPSPRDIAFATGAIVWADGAGANGGSIVTLAVTKTGAPTVVCDASGPAGVALAGVDVVFTEPAAGNVKRVPLAGGVPAILASSEAGPSHVVAAGSDVVWVNEGTAPAYADGAIRRHDGTSASTVTSNVAHPRGVAVAGGRVYWTSAGEGSVTSAALDGTGAAPVAGSQLAAAAIATDGAAVCWTTERPGGTVACVDAPGAPVVDVATDLASPHALTMDARTIWIATGDGRILKLAR